MNNNTMLNKFNRGLKLSINENKTLEIDWLKLSELMPRYRAEGWTFKGMQTVIPNLHDAPIGRFGVKDYRKGLEIIFDRNFDDNHISKRLHGNRWNLTFSQCEKKIPDFKRKYTKKVK